MKSRLLFLFAIFLFANIGLFAQTCPRCHGKGIIYFQHSTGTYGHNNSKKQCPICHQWVPSGVSHTDPCPSCNGCGSIRNSNSNHSSKSKNNSSTDNNFSSIDAAVQAMQQEMWDIAIENSYGQLKGYEGSLNQNNCYGNIGKYNPNNHVYLNTLTNKIKELNRCTTGGFSSNGAGVIIFDRNGFQAEKVPQELLDKLFEINKSQQTIRDITFSDNGTYWCVVYNFNGWFALAPQEVYDRLNSLNNKNIGIRSVALDDFGHYIIVGDDGTVLCSPKYQTIVNEARNKFGKIVCASTALHGEVVLCCDRGVYFNKISSSVADVLKKLDFIPKVMKISYTGHYLITDGNNCAFYWF